MNKKSTVEDALIQIKNVEDAINKNAQGILASTMKEEISSLVKESLKEQDEIEEPETLDVDDEETVIDDTEMDDEDMEDIDMDGEEMDDVEMIGFDDETSGVDEFSMDDETIDMTGASDAEVLKVFKAMSDSDGIVVTKNDNIISLNDGDNEYMIKINEEEEEVTDMLEYDELEEMFHDDELSEMEDEDFLSGADKNWDKDFDFSKFNDEDEDEDEMDFDFSKFNEEDEDEEEMDFETIYEIEMDDEEEDEMDFELEEEDEMDSEEDEFMLETKNFKPKGLVGKVKKVDFKSNTQGGFSEKRKEAFGGKKEKAEGTGKAKFTYKDGENLDGEFKVKPKKVEAKEASRFVKSIDRKVKSGLMAAPKQIKEEVEMLRTKNEEYRKALHLFRTKLDEVAVFNSNLAYATRLFTEHSTTKQEKINILRRFDNVETLKESKNLYRIIKDEVSSSSINESTSINESIDRTVNKTVSSGSAVNLIESKTYENPQFLRMKDLMSKIK